MIGGEVGRRWTGRDNVGTGGGEDGASSASVTRTLVRLGGGGIDRLGGGDGTSSVTEPRRAYKQSAQSTCDVVTLTTPAWRWNGSRRYVWRLRSLLFIHFQRLYGCVGWWRDRRRRLGPEIDRRRQRYGTNSARWGLVRLHSVLGRIVVILRLGCRTTCYYVGCITLSSIFSIFRLGRGRA